ncbi:MAG: hypothetical protein LBK69_00785, partial [Syntrophomonadaceae bacterium]|nr:hypothetical protein [Syntrophomonadaceae bacterium]
MKKIISILFLVCILVTAIGVPAAATGVGDINISTGRSAIAGSYYLTINGVGYTVPDTVYVGYNHTTTGYYVGVAQRAL